MAISIYNRKYIIVLCISIVIFWLYYASSQPLPVEGFEDLHLEKRIAFIIRGEAFRKGSQGNRNHGTQYTYNEQKEACATHMKLVRRLETLGYSVDVFIDTYSTQYDKDLEGWYSGVLKKATFHKKHLESQAKLIEDSIKLMKSAQIDYDTALIVRMDLFLKDKFIDEYDPSVDTVQFVSVMWTQNYKTPKGNPRVNDVIFHFPSGYFDRLASLYTSGAHNNHDILDREPLRYEEDYSLLTQNLHDSDSEKDFNPYYRMIGRKENPVWFDAGKQFPRDFI